MKSDGRPALHTKNELMNLLMEYQKNHPNEKIKYSKLEKETNVKVHIWKYQMKDIIDSINKNNGNALIPSKAGFELPSVDEIMTKCENSPKEMKNYLIVLTNMIRDLYKYKESKQTIDNITNEYENKINELESRLKDMKNKLNQQQEVINKYIIDSASEDKRLKQNIRKNSIQFNEETLKQYDEMFYELIK